jgi:beta-phosphoglucomutase-like phosphatase (HAD superfamily)
MSRGQLMHLVMFDIDGTLTESDEIDGACYLQALADVFQFTGVDGDWSQYPHCTDEGILAHLFQTRLQRLPLAEEIVAVRERFVELLTVAANTKPFQPIAGAGEFLAQLAAMNDVHVAIASGGWEHSARLKLASARLNCSQIPAAFADNAHSREGIMQSAFERALAKYQTPEFTQCTYIGDGIWDARAARQLGFRFIGIARDTAKTERLLAAGAVAVFPNYLDVERMWTALAGER